MVVQLIQLQLDQEEQVLVVMEMVHQEQIQYFQQLHQQVEVTVQVEVIQEVQEDLEVEEVIQEVQEVQEILRQ